MPKTLPAPIFDRKKPQALPLLDLVSPQPKTPVGFAEGGTVQPMDEVLRKLYAQMAAQGQTSPATAPGAPRASLTPAPYASLTPAPYASLTPLGPATGEPIVKGPSGRTVSEIRAAGGYLNDMERLWFLNQLRSYGVPLGQEAQAFAEQGTQNAIDAIENSFGVFNTIRNVTRNALNPAPPVMFPQEAANEEAANTYGVDSRSDFADMIADFQAAREEDQANPTRQLGLTDIARWEAAQAAAQENAANPTPLPSPYSTIGNGDPRIAALRAQDLAAGRARAAATSPATLEEQSRLRQADIAANLKAAYESSPEGVLQALKALDAAEMEDMFSTEPSQGIDFAEGLGTRGQLRSQLLAQRQGQSISPIKPVTDLGEKAVQAVRNPLIDASGEFWKFNANYNPYFIPAAQLLATVFGTSRGEVGETFGRGAADLLLPQNLKEAALELTPVGAAADAADLYRAVKVGREGVSLLLERGVREVDNVINALAIAVSTDGTRYNNLFFSGIPLPNRPSQALRALQNAANGKTLTHDEWVALADDLLEEGLTPAQRTLGVSELQKLIIKDVNQELKKAGEPRTVQDIIAESKRLEEEAPVKPEYGKADVSVVPGYLAQYKAAPRFSSDKLNFENPLDQAAYIIRNSGKRSKADAEYLRFVMEELGVDEDGARAYGEMVLGAVKRTDSTDGTRFIPNQHRTTAPEVAGDVFDGLVEELVDPVPLKTEAPVEDVLPVNEQVAEEFRYDPMTKKGQRTVLTQLERAGYDTHDLEDLLEEFNSLRRVDFEDAEEFAAAKEEAWDEVISALEFMDQPEGAVDNVAGNLPLANLEWPTPRKMGTYQDIPKELEDVGIADNAAGKAPDIAKTPLEKFEGTAKHGLTPTREVPAAAGKVPAAPTAPMDVDRAVASARRVIGNNERSLVWDKANERWLIQSGFDYVYDANLDAAIKGGVIDVGERGDGSRALVPRTNKDTTVTGSDVIGDWKQVDKPDPSTLTSRLEDVGIVYSSRVEPLDEVKAPGKTPDIDPKLRRDAEGAVAAFDIEADPKFPEAKALLKENERASVSMVQRRLNIGRERAVRLFDFISNKRKAPDRKTLVDILERLPGGREVRAIPTNEGLKPGAARASAGVGDRKSLVAQIKARLAGETPAETPINAKNPAGPVQRAGKVDTVSAPNPVAGADTAALRNTEAAADSLIEDPEVQKLLNQMEESELKSLTDPKSIPPGKSNPPVYPDPSPTVDPEDVNKLNDLHNNTVRGAYAASDIRKVRAYLRELARLADNYSPSEADSARQLIRDLEDIEAAAELPATSSQKIQSEYARINSKSESILTGVHRNMAAALGQTYRAGDPLLPPSLVDDVIDEGDAADDIIDTAFDTMDADSGPAPRPRKPRGAAKPQAAKPQAAKPRTAPTKPQAAKPKTTPAAPTSPDTPISPAKAELKAKAKPKPRNKPAKPKTVAEHKEAIAKTPVEPPLVRTVPEQSRLWEDASIAGDAQGDLWRQPGPDQSMAWNGSGIDGGGNHIIPSKAGGAGGINPKRVGNVVVAPLREIRPVAGEVVTTDNPVVQWLVGRSGINPSVLQTTDIGKLTVAYARQRISTRELTNTAMAWLDTAGDPAKLFKPTKTVVDKKTGKVVKAGGYIENLGGYWNDVFSNPGKYWGKMNHRQKVYIRKYLHIVREAESMRVAAGLRPRGRNATQHGWFYVPRNVEEIRGGKLDYPSNPAAQRIYDTMEEGVKHGVTYTSDPKAVLHTHLSSAYHEVLSAQLSDALEPFGFKGIDLADPKAVRGYNDAVKARRYWQREVARLRYDKRIAVGLKRQSRVDELEKQLGIVQNAYNESRIAYADAKSELLQAKLRVSGKEVTVPSTRLGRDAEAGTNTTLHLWRGRYYKPEDAKLLADKMDATLVQTGASKVFQNAGDLLRFTSSTLDWGAPWIQGLPVLARDPAGWMKATVLAYKGFFRLETQAKYISQHLRTFQEMAQYGIPTGDIEIFRAVQEGAPIGHRLRSIPGVRRFQSHYDTFLAVSRAHLWEGMRRFDPTTRAQLIRNMTGALDSAALGTSAAQRGFESTWLAFSPRLLRSTMGLLAMAAKPNTPAGADALAQLSVMMGGAVGLSLLIGMVIQGKSFDEMMDSHTGMLNPLSGKEFLSFKLGNSWVGIGGQMRAITQLIARAVTGDITSLGKADLYDNPLLAFLTSRSSPAQGIVGGALEAFTGADTAPYAEINNLGDLAEHIGKSSLPFVVQGLLENEAGELTLKNFINNAEDPDTWLRAAGDMVGLRTSPETMTEKRDEDVSAALELAKKDGKVPEEVAPALESVDSWRDLTPRERRLLAPYFEELHPGLLNKIEEQQITRGDPYAEKRKEYADFFKKEDTIRTLNTVLSTLTTGGSTGEFTNMQAAREALQDLLLQAGDIYAMDAEYQDIVSKLDPADNDFRSVLNTYYAVANKYRDPDTNDVNWDLVVPEQEKILQDAYDADPALGARLDFNVNYSIPDAGDHQLLQLWTRSKPIISKYYDATASYNDKDKVAWRRDNPLVDYQLWFWGYVSTLASEEAINMAQQTVTGRQIKRP